MLDHPSPPDGAFAAPAETDGYVTPKTHAGDAKFAGRLAGVVFPRSFLLASAAVSCASWKRARRRPARASREPAATVVQSAIAGREAARHARR